MGGERRHPLRGREATRLLREFAQKYGVDAEGIFGSRPHVEVVETPAVHLYIVNGKPVLMRRGDLLLPTLAFERFLSGLPRVTVDMGAVPHICNGADVMAPGVVQVSGEFDVGDLVAVVDERYGKFLAIGHALTPSRAFKATRRGKVVKNLHYVGDGVWELVKRFRGGQNL